MSEENSSANDFNEMRRQKSEIARKQRESTAKIEREKLEEEKSKSAEKYEQLHKNIKQMMIQDSQKKKFIVAADLLTLSDESILELYDTQTNFIERKLIIVEIKKRNGKDLNVPENKKTENEFCLMSINDLLADYDTNQAFPAIKQKVRQEILRRMKIGGSNNPN